MRQGGVRVFVVLAVSTLVLSACLVAPPAAPAQFADRQTDPVVVSGAAVTALAGVPVGDIVAFRYAAAKWSQVPVQVDQRKTIEMKVAYHEPANTTSPVNVNVYADADTWVGSSGQRTTSSIPNTDPHNGPASFFQSTRTSFFEAPGRSTADAQRHADQVAAPLTVAASGYSG